MSIFFVLGWQYFITQLLTFDKKIQSSEVNLAREQIWYLMNFSLPLSAIIVRKLFHTILKIISNNFFCILNGVWPLLTVECFKIKIFLFNNFFSAQSHKKISFFWMLFLFYYSKVERVLNSSIKGFHKCIHHSFIAKKIRVSQLYWRYEYLYANDVQNNLCQIGSHFKENKNSYLSLY